MRIAPVTVDDIESIRGLIAASIRNSVVESQDEADFILRDIDEVLTHWIQDPTGSVHLACWADARLLGVILVKKYWNLSNLFIDPEFQRKGVATALFEAVLVECRTRSPKGKLMVNSSTVAVPFYKAMGFQQSGPGLDRPGGCIPLELVFSA